MPDKFTVASPIFRTFEAMFPPPPKSKYRFQFHFAILPLTCQYQGLPHDLMNPVFFKACLSFKLVSPKFQAEKTSNGRYVVYLIHSTFKSLNYLSEVKAPAVSTTDPHLPSNDWLSQWSYTATRGPRSPMMSSELRNIK